MKKGMDISGYVEIYFIDREGNFKAALEKKNLVLPNAKSIVSKALAGIPFHVDNVKAFNTSILLGTANIVAYNFPAENQIIFKALFEESEGVGVINQLHLNSSLGGNFSELGNIEITKPDTVQMLVVWKITLINCSDSFPSFLAPEALEITEEIQIEEININP